MKQRFSVRAVIQNHDKTLLLKRANGRRTILNQYEFPGGKVAYGEQPEDTLRRYLYDDAGLHIGTAKVYDVVTYIDHDDRDIQYLVIVYRVTLSENSRDIHLSENYSKYSWGRITDEDRGDLTDLTQLLLGIIRQDDGSVATEAPAEPRADATIIYSDGGSRGNPGPSAAGFVIVDSRQAVLDEGGEYLGITTNSQAEYQAVRLGLERALERGIKNIDFRIDNMMVVNQMNGIYKVKNRELWPIHERIRELVTRFESVKFRHVRREFNRLADGVVNKVLDAHADAARVV